MKQSTDYSNNRNLALQAVSNAVDQANKWSAHVPFLLSKKPHDKNYTMIDLFSLVTVKRHEKQLFFQDKCKPSDKSSRNQLKKDLQRAFQKNGNRLCSNGSRDNGTKLTFNCFRHRIESQSSESSLNDAPSICQPCFHPNIQGKPFVRKKCAEKKLMRKSIGL